MIEAGVRVAPGTHHADGAIVIANDRLISAGTVVKSLEIATALVEAGLPVEIWTTHPGGALEARVPSGVPVIVTGVVPRLPAGLGAAVALASALRARRPAVLLSGGKLFHFRARLGLLLSGRRGATAFGGRASNAPDRPGRGRVRSAIADWFYTRKHAGMDFVVAVSRAIADDLEHRHARHRVDVRFIPNGVDRAQVERRVALGTPHRWVADPALTVVTTMGRIERQKGIDILLRAFAAIARPSLRLVLIGPARGDYATAMRQLAASLGIADRVDFTDYSDNPFPSIAGSDLFVLASRWEGASNALLEALATGVPIVATDCPTGNREILDDGRLGRLVPVEDVAALAAAMVAELDAPTDTAPREAALAERDLPRCMADYVATLRGWRDAMLARV